MMRYGVLFVLALTLVMTSCGGGATPTTTTSPTLTAPPTPTQPVVNALTDLILRTGPGPDYDETVQVPQDTPLTLLGVALGRDCAEWVLVRTSAGPEGWVRPVLVDVDVDTSVMPFAPTPTPVTSTTPMPATCSGDLALVQINNNFSKELEAFITGAEPGFTVAVGGGTSQLICVAPGQYCYDLTDGVHHETGGLFFPGGQCTCWHWGGAPPRPGSCPCLEDPDQYQRP